MPSQRKILSTTSARDFPPLRALHRFVSRTLVPRTSLVYTFAGEAPPLPPLKATMQCLPMSEESLRQYMAHPVLRQRRERYLKLLGDGLEGFMIVEGDSWASAAWIAPRAVVGHPVQVPDRISARSDWFLEAHTAEPFRGQGLHEYLVARRLQHLASHNVGRAKAAADVNPLNTASRRSLVRLGFEPAGHLHTWKPAVPDGSNRLIGFHYSQSNHPPLSLGDSRRK